jgi:hypothetical protein
VTADLVTDEEVDLDDSYVVVLVAKGGARLQPNEGIKTERIPDR